MKALKNLEERLRQLPDKPGVYIMKDETDNIIYVGKAKSLKKRVRQYFGSYGKSTMKVKSMVSNINDFEYIIVENEVESLILESNLIKKNHPKYNILLRDDKQYPYIKITINEKYPRIMKVRKISKDGAKYFGPYPAITAVNDAIDIFHRMYPIRTCGINFSADRKIERPCLNFFIKRCLGPCQGNVSEEKYMKMIEKIMDFLSGKDNTIIRVLKEKMQVASEKLDFETAAELRDEIKSLEVLLEKQLITKTDLTENQDVIAMAKGINEVLIQIFFIRAGKIIGREHYFMKDNYNEESEEILSSFIKQFYGGVAFIPKEIIIEGDFNDKEAIIKMLETKKGSKVNITIPKKGEKKDLIRMVKNNAIEMLSKYGDKYSKRQESNKKTLEKLQKLLNLEVYPKRIEAYDISNISGVESVGSMIVFENGESKKSDYRKFRIKSVKGPNDYASMREILTRRFKRGILEKTSNQNSSFAKFPDLIMMDGGKGQVNIALEVLKELEINIAVCGLVKDDFHTTRGIIYMNEEVAVERNGEIYKIIYKVQEEAHRFAINYHRSLRTDSMFKSELDGIKWIGEKRKIDLMKHFKSIEKIKKASINELLEVDSMNKIAAESLHNHFRD